MNGPEAYCKTCGQKCTPEAYKRPAEDHDGYIAGVGFVMDWCSPCCGGNLSAEPVTDRCDQCGVVAERGEEFHKTRDGIYCSGCLAEYDQDCLDILKGIAAMETREDPI